MQRTRHSAGTMLELKVAAMLMVGAAGAVCALYAQAVDSMEREEERLARLKREYKKTASASNVSALAKAMYMYADVPRGGYFPSNADASQSVPTQRADLMLPRQQRAGGCWINRSGIVVWEKHGEGRLGDRIVDPEIYLNDGPDEPKIFPGPQSSAE